jgi:hypothetical protein
MFLPRGIPEDVDDETYGRIARSFYVVRMVRYSLLVVFLLIFLVGFELKGWSRAATVVLGLAALGVLVLMARTHQRYVSGRPAPSGSPTG